MILLAQRSGRSAAQRSAADAMRCQCVRDQIALQFMVQFLGTGFLAGGAIAMRSDSGSASDRESAIGIRQDTHTNTSSASASDRHRIG